MIDADPIAQTSGLAGLIGALQLLGDPKAQEAVLRNLAAVRDEAIKEQQTLVDLQTKRDELEKDRAAVASQLASEQSKIDAAHATLAENQAAFDAAKQKFDAAFGMFATQRADLNAAKSKHQQDVAEFNRKRAALTGAVAT